MIIRSIVIALFAIVGLFSASIVWLVYSLNPQLLLVAAIDHIYLPPVDYFVRPVAKLRVRLLNECPWKDADPQTAIGFIAAEYSSQDADRETVETVIKLLIRKGCDINSYNERGETPLHDAVVYNNAELVSFLLSLGADKSAKIHPYPNMPAKRQMVVGLTPLEWANFLSEHTTNSTDFSKVISILSANQNGT